MLRFHSPLIEPDVQIYRIRLSDKGNSHFRFERRVRQSPEPQQAQRLMQIAVRVACPLRPPHAELPYQPPTEPVASVGCHPAIGGCDCPQTEVVAPASDDAVET